MCLMVLAILAGCSNLRVTDPPRTATEQFLLSRAATKAIDPLSFEILHGRKVFVDTSFLSVAEKEFVLGKVRARLLESGVSLMASREQAEIILEVRSGGLGIDRYESLLGLPSLFAPAGASSVATGTPMATLITPELAISKKIRQVGYASVSYVAYWSDTGEIVASSAPSIGRTYREDWWFLGFGPRSLGDIPPVEYDFD